MRTRLTRRNILATLGVGTATALAGCGLGDDTDDGVDSNGGDDATPPSGDDTGSDDGTGPPSSSELLFVASGQTRTLEVDTDSSYDGVEMEPGSALALETGAAVTVRPSQP